MCIICSLYLSFYLNLLSNWLTASNFTVIIKVIVYFYLFIIQNHAPFALRFDSERVCKTDTLIRFRYFRLYWYIYIMWVLYAVLTILLAYQCAVYAHSYVYITSSTHIVSYSIKSQSSELVHSFTVLVCGLRSFNRGYSYLRPDLVVCQPDSSLVYKFLVRKFTRLFQWQGEMSILTWCTAPPMAFWCEWLRF